MKKVTSLLLVVAMMFSMLLSGCGNAEKTEVEGSDAAEQEVKTESETATDTTVEETLELEPMTLKLVMGGNGGQQDEEKVIARANEILAELVPNTTIEVEFIPMPEYSQKFDLMMAAQETVDIAWNSWSQSLSQTVNNGALLPLDELMTSTSIQDEIPAWLLDGGKVQGVQYMIPKYEMHFWQLAMWAPQDRFEKYFDLEKSKEVFLNANQEYIHVSQEMWDLYDDYLTKANEGGDLGGGYSPWVNSMNEGTDLIGGAPQWSYKMPATVRMYTPGNEWDFTVHNTYKMEENITMFKQLAEWKEKGFIAEDMLAMDNPRAVLENANDEKGATLWFHGYMNPKQEGDFYVEDRYTKTNVRVPVQQFPVVKTNANDGLTIPITAQDPVRSMMVIELLETEKGKEFYNTLVFGIEGDHYTKEGDNRIVYDVGTNDRRSLDATYGQAGFVLGNVHNKWVTQEDTVDDYNDYWEMMHQSGIVSPLAGFKYNDENYSSEVIQIKSVLSEYMKGFMSGYYTEELYTEFLEKLDKANVEEVIADVQVQLDTYLEAEGISKTGYVMK